LHDARGARSRTNLTREDGREFMRIASEIDLRPAVEPFPLARASEALQSLADGKLRGAAVLTSLVMDVLIPEHC
jgi:propanol-preferring alcohol dehydrogenase